MVKNLIALLQGYGGVRYGKRNDMLEDYGGQSVAYPDPAENVSFYIEYDEGFCDYFVFKIKDVTVLKKFLKTFMLYKKVTKTRQI